MKVGDKVKVVNLEGQPEGEIVEDMRGKRCLADFGVKIENGISHVPESGLVKVEEDSMEADKLTIDLEVETNVDDTLEKMERLKQELEEVNAELKKLDDNLQGKQVEVNQVGNCKTFKVIGGAYGSESLKEAINKELKKEGLKRR